MGLNGYYLMHNFVTATPTDEEHKVNKDKRQGYANFWVTCHSCKNSNTTFGEEPKNNKIPTFSVDSIG